MWRITPAALLTLVLLGASFSEVHAHQRLLRAEPADSSAIAEPPRVLRLYFQEPIELAFTRVEVLIDGRLVSAGELRAGDSPTELIVPLAGNAGGRYTVRWSTAGRDGHPVRGEYEFVVTTSTPAGEAAGAAPAPGNAQAPAEHHAAVASAGFDADSAIYVVIRWLGFIALLCLVGTIVFATIVLRGVVRRGGGSEAFVTSVRSSAAGLGLVAALVLSIAAVGRLLAQSLAMHGATTMFEAGLIATLLTRTVWGWGWLLQVVGALAAAIGFVIARRGNFKGWWLAGAAALLLVATPALAGHAAAMAGAGGVLAVLNDALHVAAAGAWLGTLFALVMVGLRAAAHSPTGQRTAAVAELVAALSPVALTAAGLLVISGTISVIIHSGSLAALIASRYGWILLLKLTVFAAVIGLGAYNFMRLKPRLDSPSVGVTLRRSAALELGAGALVLLVTALLVATARPVEEEATLAVKPPLSMEQRP